MNKTHLKQTEKTGLEIAVIGLAGRFPGAKNIREFQDNLEKGNESIRFFSDDELLESGIAPEEFNHPNYVKAKGYLENADVFDAAFFDYIPSEAMVLDPQARIFHETVWEALEDAGYASDSYKGLIGLYAGATASFLWEAMTMISGASQKIDAFTASQLVNKDYLGTRISYKLNLKGPSVITQTACSTSLAAIHQACRALLTGECNMALAGGVTISSLNKEGYMSEEGMITSSDGHCRAFDAQSQGTVGGDGAGVVLLKPLEEALNDCDHIYAVVKGSAMNNDGTRKVGYTAPSVEGQADVIRMAQHFSRISAESISYIEAHGTATALGDPVEVEALKLAFDTTKKNFCGIGTVKSNIGHLDSAAGVAGFIKTALALEHQLIPPTLHFNSPNPKIDFENSPFYVVSQLTKWQNQQYPLRAGVSAFGIGGTNVHVILEEAPPLPKNSTTMRNRQLLVLSAKSTKALDRAAAHLADHLRDNPDIDLEDASHTLQVGRKAFKYRRTAIVSSIDDTIAALTSDSFNKRTLSAKLEKVPVIFMFSGQGSQYINMGLELYQSEPAFRQEVDNCFQLLRSVSGIDMKKILYPAADDSQAAEKINRFNYTSPIKFIFEYSIAKL
ncbi:MAG: type I polyketide synthase, partial [bacterium]|nr:type I polyketide synthase [bacterium]